MKVIWKAIIIVNQPTTLVSQSSTVMPAVGTIPKMEGHSNQMKLQENGHTSVIHKAGKMDDVRGKDDSLLTLPVLTFNMSIKHQRKAVTGLVTCSTKT